MIIHKLNHPGMPLNSTRQPESLVTPQANTVFSCSKAGLMVGAKFAALVNTTDEQ